jgi:hypothetical protein
VVIVELLLNDKHVPNKIYWACQKHLKSAKQCPIKAVPEASLEVAFCNMMNKLVYSRKFLLQPLLENLQVQANSDTHGQTKFFNRTDQSK